jgi:hypothetical protein
MVVEERSLERRRQAVELEIRDWKMTLGESWVWSKSLEICWIFSTVA